MSKLFSIVLVLCAVLVASRTVLYTRNVSPRGWSLVSQAPEDASVSFTLALKQRNIDVLEKIVTAVSDPDSDDYQAFLTSREILDIVAPPADVQEKVIAQLVSAGVSRDEIKNLGDALDVRASVDVASSFFQTKFFEFQHSVSGKKIVRSFGSYSLPNDIAAVVDMVVGLASFPVPHLDAHRHFASAVSGKSQIKKPAQRVQDTDMAVIPQTYYLMYKIPAETYGNATLTSQGVIEFESQTYSPTDLQSYATAVNIQVLVPTANTTVGPNDPSSAQIEAQLDVEAMGCVNDEVALWFWLEAGSGWQYAFTTHFFSTPSIPTVISISYAWSELDQCQAGIGADECSQLGVDAQGYVARVNTEYMKIAGLGVSTFSASGDSGANGRTDSDCSANILKPDYPAASPWITSVGATQLTNAVALTNPPSLCTAGSLTCAATGTEVAVSYAVAQFASGGGFSWYSAQPAWQKTAVNKYLTSQASKLPPASYFNATGRGFPDVAALGHNFAIVANGQTQLVGGTSVSSPVVASLFSLLNQVSLKKTNKPLGFVSPLLYKMYADDSSIFTDVTVGDNKCTEGGCSPSCQGFICAPGWDPVTGLGTLSYQAAENYLIKMLDARAARKASK